MFKGKQTLNYNLKFYTDFSALISKRNNLVCILYKQAIKKNNLRIGNLNKLKTGGLGLPFSNEVTNSIYT